MQYFIFHWLVIGFLIFNSLASFASPDLVQIYQLALKKDSTLKIAESNYLSGLETKKIARAALLPQLNGFLTYAKNDTEELGVFPITFDQDGNPMTEEVRALRHVDSYSEEDKESLGVSFQQALFNLSVWFNYRAGMYQEQISMLEYKLEQQNLIMRVADAYFEVLRLSENLDVSQSMVHADKKQLDSIRKRARVGSIAQVDVVQAQAVYDISQATLLEDEDLFNVAIETLGLLVGQKIFDLREFDARYQPALPDPANAQYWSELAKQNNLAIKVAYKGQLLENSKLRSYMSTHLPTIGVEARYTRSKSEVEEVDNALPLDFDSDSENQTLALNASIPLFSGGKISAQRRKAKFQYHSATETYVATFNEVVLHAEVAYRSAVNLFNRLSAKKRIIESNRQVMELMRDGYNAGIYDISYLLDAQKSLSISQRNYQNDKYQYILAVFRLKQLAGMLSTDDLIDLNQYLH